MKIFICGDSTAASYTQERYPMTGWGQVLPEFVPGAEVVNAAAAGRSTKSFLSEGRLTAIEREIAPGDLLLVQFGHNDENPLAWRHTDPWTSYMNTLSIFIDTARLYGAVPVLLTPICIRAWKDGVLLPSHDDYPEAVRTLAAQRGVPLIDMYEKSLALVKSLGEEKSRELYMNFPAGMYPTIPEGRQDNAHTRPAGAEAYARMAAEGLREFGLV